MGLTFLCLWLGNFVPRSPMTVDAILMLQSRIWCYLDEAVIEQLSGKIGGERSRINSMWMVWMVQFYSISGGIHVTISARSICSIYRLDLSWSYVGPLVLLSSGLSYLLCGSFSYWSVDLLLSEECPLYINTPFRRITYYLYQYWYD